MPDPRPWLVVLLALTLAAPATHGREDAAYQFLLAQALAQDGSYREALALYQRVVDLEPDEPFVRVEYAELLFRLGRLTHAAEQIEQARRLNPVDPEVLRLFGQIHLRLAETRPEAMDRAREAFEVLREEAPLEIEPLVTLGQIYLGQGRPEEAAVLFSELLEQRPADRMLMSFLLEALQRADRVAAGEDELLRFLEIDPGFVKARMALAEIQSARGDHAAAAATLEAAPHGNSGSAEVRRQLAVELYRAEQPRRSLEVLDRFLEQEPRDFGARYLRALVLIDLGRVEEAGEGLESLRLENPENLDITVLLSRILEQEQRAEDAARLLEEAATLLAGRGRADLAREARLRLTELLVRRERWQRVLDLTGELLAEENGSAVEPTLLRAEALSRLGDPDGALQILRELEPGLEAPAARVVAKKAEVMFEAGRDAEARQALEPLTGADDLEALLLAADVLQRRELYAAAIPVLVRALEREPESLQLLFRLGASYEREGRRGEAEGAFRRLLERNPEFAPALNYLGYMWAEQGENLSEALDLVSRAVALDPENGAYIDSLGWAYFQLGRYQEARDQLERAAELVPDDAVIHEHLGDLYLAVGERERAQRLYRRALSLEGENEEAVRRKLREISENL